MVTVDTISTAGCVLPHLRRDWTRLRDICTGTGCAARGRYDLQLLRHIRQSVRLPDQTHTAHAFGAVRGCVAVLLNSGRPRFAHAAHPYPYPYPYHSMPLPALPIMPANSPNVENAQVLDRVRMYGSACARVRQARARLDGRLIHRLAQRPQP